MPVRFKTKILVIQLIAILPFLLFIFYIFDIWFDVSRGQVLTNNLTETKLLAKAIDQTLNIGFRTTAYLANDQFFPATRSGSINLKALQKISPELSELTIVDDSGHIRSSSLTVTSDVEGKSLSERIDVLRQTVEEKGAILTQPILGKVTERWSIIVATPIIKDETVTGTVNASIQLEYLKSLLEHTNQQNLSEDKNIMLLDNKGHVVFTLFKPFEPPTRGADLSNLDIVKEVQKGRSLTGENITFLQSDKKMLAAITPVGNTTWSVLSVEPENDIYAPLFQTQNRMWIVVLVSFVFSFSVITFYLRRIRVVM
jgi:hypothetical protein